MTPRYIKCLKALTALMLFGFIAMVVCAYVYPVGIIPAFAAVVIGGSGAIWIMTQEIIRERTKTPPRY